MKFPGLEYFAPETVQEALRLLIEKGDGAYVLAGGTDLVVKMTHGLLTPKAIIDLKKIRGLNEIRLDGKEGLTIGATALLADVASHPGIIKNYPAIAYAAQNTANVQIRNMGTVAGNLCNAAPSADNAPTLMAMGAKATLVSVAGERQLPLDQFFEGPGLTAMRPGTIMTSIFIPHPPPKSGASYKHLSARSRVDISAVCVGAMLTMDGETCKEGRIALGAVAPTPMRATKAEAVICGQKLTEKTMSEAGKQASEESRPISDIRASADYRKKMVAVLTRQALKEARERALKR